MQFNTKLRFFLENWTKNLENISLYPSFNWRYQLFRLNEIFKKNFEQVMNPPQNKKNPFPISFSNFSGKYILKTAFIIRFMYWYIQKRKQKRKTFSISGLRWEVCFYWYIVATWTGVWCVVWNVGTPANMFTLDDTQKKNIIPLPH